MDDSYSSEGIAQGNLSNNKKGKEVNQSWLLTYSDMITLLFTFVLLILKVSDIDENRFDELREGLSQTFLKQDVSTAFKTLSEEAKTLKEKFNEVSVSVNNKEINITFADSSFYEVGSANITEDGLLKINELLDVIDQSSYNRYQIEVEGHTDDVPIHNNEFSSNWELSTARATNIVKTLVADGVMPDRVRAIGYSDTKPIRQTILPSGEIDPLKRGLNRRIVIKISRYNK